MDTVKSEKKISLIKKLFSDPLLRPIEVFGTIAGLLLVVYSFTESNRLTWLNNINTTSLELSKMEIEKDFITCLYKSEDSEMSEDDNKIHKVCDKEVFKGLNIKKATLYLEESLDFFIDIIKYDKKYWWKSDNEFILYYKEWYCDLHGDNNITEKFRTEYIDDKIIFINEYIKEQNYQNAEGTITNPDVLKNICK